MEKQTKNLGHVTAYGYAKSQGYTGTEAEYAALMASYATVAERAETAAESAEQSAQEVHDVIPEVTAQDNGKVMMVENGEWGAGEVDVLPPVTSQDNGKVLGVVEGQWAKTEPEDGLPEVTSSDNGKVLSVVEGEWAPAEAGSGLPEVTSEDNGDLLSVVNGTWAKSEPGYRPAMVDGTVIVQEQECYPEEYDAEYYTNIYPDSPQSVYDWFEKNSRPETLPVVFNGTKYNVPTTGIEALTDVNKYFFCGEVDGEEKPVFTAYPFCIKVDYSRRDGILACSLKIYTPTADSFTIKIAEEVHTAIPTEDFKLAVNNSYMETPETEKVTIPEQSVTTAVHEGDSFVFGSVTDFTMPGENDPTTFPGTIHVTFNGTEYDLPRIDPERFEYGAPWGDDGPDFTTYPIQVAYAFDGGEQCFIATPEAGTYTIEATYIEAKTAPTEKFKEAVHGVVQTGAWFEVSASNTIDSQTTELTLYCTPEDIWSAISRGQNLSFVAQVSLDGDTTTWNARCPLTVYEFENTGYFDAKCDLIVVGNSSIAAVSIDILDSGAYCTYREVTFS